MVLVLAGLALQLAVVDQRSLALGPPPRPTLTPTLISTPAPTRAPSAHRPTAAPSGRITGTVIDLSTSAPAPHIAVTVGDQTVYSDDNGNYNRADLPAGSYVVALDLAPRQGMPAQEPVTVALGAGATVVQHLTFSSRAAATAVAPPPQTLPNTGGSGDGSALLPLLPLLGGGLLLILIGGLGGLRRWTGG